MLEPERNIIPFDIRYIDDLHCGKLDRWEFHLGRNARFTWQHKWIWLKYLDDVWFRCSLQDYRGWLIGSYRSDSHSGLCNSRSLINHQTTDQFLWMVDLCNSRFALGWQHANLHTNRVEESHDVFVASKHHHLVSKGREIAEHLCCTRCPNGIEVNEDVVEDQWQGRSATRISRSERESKRDKDGFSRSSAEYFQRQTVAFVVIDSQRVLTQWGPDSNVLPFRQLLEKRRSLTQCFRLTFAFVDFADFLKHACGQAKASPMRCTAFDLLFQTGQFKFGFGQPSISGQRLHFLVDFALTLLQLADAFVGPSDSSAESLPAFVELEGGGILKHLLDRFVRYLRTHRCSDSLVQSPDLRIDLEVLAFLAK